MMRQQSTAESEKRKRGRPSGKNRVPLSLEERRARNAQYERERRNEKSEAMSQLAEAAGCEPTLPAADLLATVISQIHRAAKRKSSEDIENLRRINDNLMSQIDKLENQLKMHCPEFDSTNLDELLQQAELSSTSSLQSDESESTKRRDTRTKKNPGKRKRKNFQRKQSDSQDSNDLHSEDEVENAQAKRVKCQLKTHEMVTEAVSTRPTRSSPSSHSSDETSHDDVVANDVMGPTTSEVESPSYQNSQEVSSEEMAIEGPLWTDSNMIVHLELPSMLVGENSTADYILNEVIQQPFTQYSPDLNYESIVDVQDPVEEPNNENPFELEIPQNINMDIFLEREAELINNCDWFDSSIFLNNHDIGSNLVFS